MTQDYKSRIRKIIEDQHRKEITTHKPRKNDNPEARLMLDIKNHLIRKGWSVDIIDAKGTWSPESGTYKTGKVRAGYSDISGNDDKGSAIYIEVKAKGKRHNISSGQYWFLLEKIKTNSFAIVADSIEYIDTTYDIWAKTDQKILLKELPDLPTRYQDQAALFENEP